MSGLFKRLAALAVACALFASSAFASEFPTIPAPAYWMTFNTIIAKRTPVSDFLFGSSVSPSPGQTAIRNATDLANYFTYLEDFAGTIVTGTTMGSDKPFTSSGNYVFGASNLQLTATLDGGSAAMVALTSANGTTSFTSGVSVLLSSITGLSSTAPFWVGEVVADAFHGAYVITAIPDGTHLTLTAIMGAATTGGGNFEPIAFTPWSYAVSTAASSGGCANFSAGLPSQVVVGQSIYWILSGAANATNYFQVTSVPSSTQMCGQAPGSVNLPTIASGTGYLFGPAIGVAQIWDKNAYQVPVSDTNGIAMEFTVILPDSKGIGANFSPSAAVAANAPIGAWPAIWWYSHNVAPAGITTNNKQSEFDLIELNLTLNQGFKNWTGNNHGFYSGTGTVKFIQEGAGTWTPAFNGSTSYSPTGGNMWAQYCAMSADPSQPAGTVVKYEIIATGGKTYRFVNGIPLRVDTEQWDDQYPAHWSVGIADGAWNQISAFHMPMSNGQFPFSLAISRAEIWTW